MNDCMRAKDGRNGEELKKRHDELWVSGKSCDGNAERRAAEKETGK